MSIARTIARPLGSGLKLNKAGGVIDESLMRHRPWLLPLRTSYA